MKWGVGKKFNSEDGIYVRLSNEYDIKVEENETRTHRNIHSQEVCVYN